MTGVVRILPPADPDPVLRAWMALVPDVFSAGASLGRGIDRSAMDRTHGERTLHSFLRLDYLSPPSHFLSLESV